MSLLPTGFLPEGDSNLSQVKVTLAPGTRLEETAEVSDRIVRQLLERPEVKDVLATTSDGVSDFDLLIKLKPP